MTEAVAAPAQDIDSLLDEFVRLADQKSVDHYQRMNFTLPPPKHRVKKSEKWAKVITLDHNGKDGSVFAFICLQDGETRTLGKLKKGDIHKPASWNAPAKHARGNLFHPKFAESFTSFGPHYLK